MNNNNNPIWFFFSCHLSQRPPSSPVAFPVLCPSWVMDYLSAVSQYNHIQFQSFPKMMPLFISSLVRQLLLPGFGVSSIDFQLFSLLLFLQYSEAEASLHIIASFVCICNLSLEICTFEIPNILLFSFFI